MHTRFNQEYLRATPRREQEMELIHCFRKGLRLHFSWLEAIFEYDRRYYSQLFHFLFSSFSSPPFRAFLLLTRYVFSVA